MITELLFLLVLFFLIYILPGIKIVPEYERLVIFRLGRLVGVRGPGVTFVLPGIEKAQRVDLRVQTVDIPNQEVITKDNINIRVDAVVMYRIIDPLRTVLSLRNPREIIYYLAQSALRDVLGDFELDEILVKREVLAQKIQEIVDSEVEGYGIKVSKLGLQQIILPEQLVRAMAAQAEAERERRAKIISAEGERQAAQIIAEAAEYFERHPVALRLRELNVLLEVAKEKNLIILFPIGVQGAELAAQSLGLASALKKVFKLEESSGSK